jgi:hypothetical protein
MLQETITWLREEAHKLVQIARTLDDPKLASHLEGLAIEMLARALDIEKSDSL